MRARGLTLWGRVAVFIFCALLMGSWSRYNARYFEAVDSQIESPMAQLVDLKWLLAQKARNQILIVDVRSAEAYSYGHIDGAISWPDRAIGPVQVIVETERRQLVVYGEGGCVKCSGTTGVGSLTNLEKVTRQPIAIYYGGFAEWIECRLPLMASDELLRDMSRGLR